MKRWFYLVSGLCLMAVETLVAQAVPPLLEKTAVRSTASAERSTLNRTSGVLTSTVDVVAVNLSGRRIIGPVHAVLSFKTPEGTPVNTGITVPGSQGGFRQAPWQLPYLDLTAQSGADGWQPGESLTLPLTFSRDRSLQVLYEVTFAGRINRDPVVDPGGPYAGQGGAAIIFSGAAEDPDGDPLTFTWDFGDGTRAATAQAEHAFASAGVKALKLTVDDGNGGIVVRDVNALVVPSGQFALAHTRVVEANGHPLPRAVVTETGPQGNREFAGEDSGFVSLGASAGDYRWKFTAPGHRPVWRKTSLAEGDLKLLPSPWLAPIAAPVELSVLEAVTLTNATAPGAAAGSVRLVFPAGAFTQPGAARLTALGPQALPFPLGFGWSPLAAFHLDLPEVPTAGAAARLKLTDRAAAGELVTLVQFDESALEWKVVSHQPGSATTPDELAFTLTSGGTWAAVVRDTGTGAPELPDPGDALVPGTPQNLQSAVTAISSALPSEMAASLDPAAVTGEGEAVFTPASGILPSGSWFRLGVQESYDLTDGTGLRTPDYDTTVYAYRRPAGQTVAAVVPRKAALDPRGGTVSRSQLLQRQPERLARDTGEGRPAARFPLRPRLLFSPSDLKQANVHVDVLPPLGTGASVLSREGGVLESGGIRVTVPPDALGAFAAGSLRALEPTGFAGLVPSGFSIAGVFELNLSGLAPGVVLGFSLNRPVTPATDFMLTRLVSFSGGSGLAPIQRLRSDAAGLLTNAEPSSPPRLPGLEGPGQYLLVQLPAAQGMVHGLVRNASGDPVTGIGVRVTGQSWLSVTGTDGRYFLTLPAGQGTVLASNSANGDGAAADFTMPAGLASQSVDLTLGSVAPRVLVTTPVHQAERVPSVTPLIVEFSEKIAPASLGANPLTLRADGAAADVPTGFTLDLSNRILTLLPVNPLEPATDYTLTVSAGIRDLQNLALSGPLEFTFTTAAPAARGEGAQLVIYEPGATNVPTGVLAQLVGYQSGAGSTHVVASGGPGTADAKVPVILVNESTGETATVISKSDGSFANFLNADEADFLSAVFVNANGTRLTIPASRQQFDDGRVGLYKAGGILEAENQQPGAPMEKIEVIIEPESVPSRTVFRLESASPAALQQLLATNPPESGNIPGAFRYEVFEGEEPTVPPVVVFPATRAQLGLTEDEDPRRHTFALCEADTEGGIPYYKIVDRMKYENGKLITSSPPFPGPTSSPRPSDEPAGRNDPRRPRIASAAISSILLVPLRMAFGFSFTALGRVVSARASDLPVGAQISGDEERALRLANGGLLVPVPGALVFGSSGGSSNTTNRLRPGAFAAKANNLGFYATVVPYSPLDPEAILLSAAHPALPNLSARGVIVPDVQDSVALPVGVKHLAFILPDAATADFSPPVIQADPGQAVLPVGENFTLTVRVEDALSKPQLVSALFDAAQSQADDPATVLGAGSVTVLPGVSTDVSPKVVVVQIRLRAFQAMRAGLRLTAVDEAGNERTRVVFLRFGEPPPPVEELKLVDEGDTTGPMLTGSLPGEGIPLTSDSVALQFSEPLSRTCLEPSAITATGATVTRRLLSRDQRTLTLTLGGITKLVAVGDALAVPAEITVALSPSFVTDLAGNALQGDNMLVFPQLTERIVDLAETGGAVAVTMAGNCVATLRNLGGEGRVMLHAGGSGMGTAPLGSALTPAFPRAMVFLPAVTFYQPDKVPPPGFVTLGPSQNPLSLPGRVRTADLIAVTGGLTGDGQIGPWLRLIDITDPAHPSALATSLVTGDFTTTASMLKWSPPRLLCGVFTTEGTQIRAVNVQGFIIGCQGYSRGTYGFGLDLNLDGDYVDGGEQPPVPQHFTLFGLEDIISPPDKLSINDYAAQGGGATLVAVTRSSGTRPSQLHVLRAPGVVLNAGEGVLNLPNGTYRVLLDQAFPLEDATGTRAVPAALLTATNQLLVVSLLDPQHPVIVRQHTLAAVGATIFSLTETSREELVVAATDGTRTLSRTALGRLVQASPVRERVVELPLGGGRSIGASTDALATFSSSDGTRLLRRRPGIGIVQFPTGPVRSITTVMALPEPERGGLFSQATERGFLPPGFFTGTDLAPLDPPDADLHHYVLVRASGALGTRIRVGVQSLAAAEAPAETPPCPVCPVPSGDVDRAPSVQFFLAQRLSNDPKAALFNQFLAGPFVIVRQPLSQAQENEVDDVEGRLVLWGGEQIRAFLAADPLAHAELRPYIAEESGGQIKPKVVATYRSFRPDYIDSPNPSGRSAPRLMGGLVDLQGGEITLPETDVAVEGRHQDLVFRRLYQSRSIYTGVLGRNWDHNFNARVQEFTEGDFSPAFATLFLDRGFEAQTARTGDVILIDGGGTTHLFRKIGPAHGNEARLPEYQSDPALAEFWGLNGKDKIRAFYQSPDGVFVMLLQLNDLKWVLVGTGGHRTYFNPNGSLDRLVGARAASVITCHYRSGDGLLGEVRGDNGGRLRFGYYYPFLDRRRTGPIDPPSDDPCKCGHLAVVHGQLSGGPGGQRVEFDYDRTGNLISATPSWRRPIIYGYDEENPRLLTRFGEQDSTVYPSATISYINGLVKSINTGGELLEVGGAALTAKERFQAGPSAVTLGPAGGPGAQIAIDARGQPTAFGGRAMAADAEGQLSSFETLTRGVTLVYDRDNPVRRFRGNLIRTERRALNGGPPVVSTTGYDGKAFNRPDQLTNPNGVVTDLLHFPGEERATTGGLLTLQTLINAFGQKTAQSRNGGPVPLSTQFDLDVVSGLPAGTTGATSASLSRDDIGRVREQRQGAVGTTHDYDPQTGRLRALVPLNPALQPRLDWTYDADGRPETETLSGGGLALRHAFTYHTAQPGRAATVRVSETGLPDTLTTTGYDVSGRLTSSDVDGIPATFAYTGAILTALTTPSLSRSLTLVNGADVASITENGVTTDFGYDASGRVLTVQTAGKRTTLLYDPGAAGTARERLSGKIISAPNEQLPPPEIVEGYAYDPAGRLSTLTASSGRVRGFTYHADGRLHQALINGRVVRQIDLRQDGQVTAVTLGNLRRTLSSYDPGHGRPLSEMITWTDSGQSLSVSYGYDATGRVQTTSYPSGTYTSGYDVFGHVRTRSDPDGVSLTYGWSPSGVPLSCQLADGSSVTYQAGPGRRRERTVAVTGSKVLAYEDHRLSALTQPDGTVLTFKNYNQFQAAEKVTNGSVEQTLGYDARGRLTSITSPTENAVWKRSFDVFERPLGSSLGTEETRYLYNKFDALSGEVALSGPTEIGRWTLDRDVLDRTLSETYPSGLRLEFVPDAFGQPTAVAATGLQSVQWHGLGMPSEVVFSSGLKIRWIYDASFRTEKIEYLPATGSAAGFAYAFTPGGRLLSETRLHESRRDEYVRNGPAEAMRITDFNFGVQVAPPPGPPPGPQAFVRGFGFANGEVRAPTATSAASPAAGDLRGFFPPLARQEGSNRLSAIDGVPVLHNDRGSLEKFPVWIRLPGGNGLVRTLATATWDGVGNLVRVVRDDGVIVAYTRDGEGRIGLRTVTGPADRCVPSSTRYFWAGQRLLEERDAATPALALLRRYHYLGGRLMLMEAAQSGGAMDRFVPLVGLNGSIGGYLDDRGALLHTIHYGPYGLPVPPVGDAGLSAASASSPLLFHGAYFDEATGLYEMGERHLHPLTGGFLERDGALFVESLAWFTAFNGDPAGRVDPFGRLSDTVDSLSSFVDLAKKGQPLYQPAMGVLNGTHPGEEEEEEEGHVARVKSGIDLITAGIDLYLTNQDDDTRANWAGVTKNLGKAKEIVDKFKDFEEAIGGDEDEDAEDEAEEEAEPWSSEARWGWLKDTSSEMLLFPSLSGEGMELPSADLHAFASTKLARAGMPGAPEFTDDLEAPLKNIGRAKIGLAAGKLALDLLEPEFLKDPHNKQIADQAYSTANAALSLAEIAVQLRGDRALAAIRANPIEALSASFDFGFEAGKLGIIALSDPETAKAYEAQAKKFEDDGGFLTVGSGILSTLGADDTAMLIQSIADAPEIDALGSIQTVFENALAERARRQELTEYYLRGISAP